MKPHGIQHIAEFIGCKKDILNNANELEKLVLSGIKESGLNHESIISHQFSPGVTVLAIISESHIGLHTYPEARHVSLDVFTCSVPEKQIKLIKFLRKNLKPRIVKIVEIQGEIRWSLSKKTGLPQNPITVLRLVIITPKKSTVKNPGSR